MRRYFLKYYDGSMPIQFEVFPDEKGVSIEGDELAYCSEKRRVLKGKLVFIKDTVYDLVRTGDECREYEISVNEYCGAFAKEIYKGAFTIRQCVVDYDNCTIDVAPITKDAYTGLLKYKDYKHNLLTGIEMRTVTASLEGYPQEHKVTYDLDPGLPTAPSFIVDTDHYTLFEEIWEFDDFEMHYFITKVWVREKYENFTSTPPSTGTGWVDLGQQPDGRYKWVRRYGGLPTGTYVESIRGRETVYSLEETLGGGLIIDRALLLTDVMAKLLSFTGLNGFMSNFLQQNTNPVTGTNPNPLKHLMLVQVSDARGYADPAWLGEMTLWEAIQILCETFNMKFFVNVQNRLQMEHVSWFSKTVGLDIRTAAYAKYVDGKRKWKYDDSIPTYEEWELLDAHGSDFKGQPIYYTCFTNTSERNVVTHEIPGMMFDLYYLRYQAKDAPDEGFLLVQADLTPSSEYVFGYEVGKISGVNRINGHLSLANLHEAYWKHGRYLMSGTMNYENTAFLSKVRNRIGEMITIPMNGFDFDENKMVRTPLGYGEVRSFEYDFATGHLKLLLGYQ